MPTSRRPVVFGGAISVTVTLLILLQVARIPWEGRLFVAVMLAAGWLVAGVLWLNRRFGKKVFLALSIFGLALGGAAGYAYWQDEPNRRLVAQVRQLGAYYVGTTGTFLTGKIDYVYFDSEASDEQVRQFTELQGLDGLERLVFKRTRISDTTVKRLGRFSRLRLLYIEGSEITQETVDQLQDQLPNCDIEIK